MKDVLLIQLVLLITSAQAQTPFEKLYVGGGSLDVIEIGSHNLLSGFHGSSNGPGMSLLDAEGSVIEMNTFVQYPFLVPMAYKQTDINAVYFVSGYVSGSCDVSPLMFPVVGKMDTAGNVQTLSHFEFDDACKSLPVDLEITHDKGVVTWGWQYDFFALRVDSSLNPVWVKHFNHHGHFQFIKELPGGDLLAGFDMDTVGGAVARLNANGDFLWCKSYMRPSGSVKDCIIESDSSFIIIGLTDDSYQNLFMMNVDGEGEVQWCRGYSSGQPWYGSIPTLITRTNDEGYALLATNGSRPVLMKTDLNGDTLWTRTYGVQGYNYETWALLASSDGGYLISGMVMGNLPDMNSGLPCILKADSFGSLPCTPTIPRSYVITELFPTDSSFTLVPTDEVVTAFPGNVTDTTYAPIVTYDGCIITSVPGAMGTLGPRPRIRPNPNAGHFTVQFADPLSADSFFSVYDAVGKLLFQRPLVKGQESEEIDLSRFAKGTYLVRVSDRSGVCYERVVVQ